jgi:hypothetical protein
MDAQIGLGGGAAAIGKDVRHAGGELRDVLTTESDELTYDDISGQVGIFAQAGFKFGFGGPRLAASIGYDYFQNSQVKLTKVNVGQSVESSSATFDVGTSLIPIAAGGEYAFPISTVRPYVGVYPTYTIINRTYTFVQGDGSLKVGNESAGENEVGAGTEIGIEFPILSSMTVAVSARYTMMNLFTRGEGEENQGLLHVGASVWFGEIFDNRSSNDGDREE